MFNRCPRRDDITLELVAAGTWNWCQECLCGSGNFVLKADKKAEEERVRSGCENEREAKSAMSLFSPSMLMVRSGETW